MNKQVDFSPEFEQEVHAALSIAEVDVEFLSDLRMQVLQQQRELGRKARAGRFHWRPVWAVAISAVVLTMLVVLAVGPQNVLAAVQRLIGYIPGIGFVDNSQPVLQLAGPVIEQRGDVTIRVESAASDGQNTRINLRVEGLGNPAGRVEAKGQGDHHLALRLKDGKTLPLRGYQVNYQPAFTIRIDFAQLPQDTQDATLTFNVIPGIPQGAGPEEWTFPLRFTTGQAYTAITEGSSLMLDSAPIDGVVLRLLNVSKTANGTAVQVQLNSEIPNTFIVTSRTDKLYLLDSEGHFIPFVGDPLFSPGRSDTMTSNYPGDRLWPANDPGSKRPVGINAAAGFVGTVETFLNQSGRETGNRPTLGSRSNLLIPWENDPLEFRTAHPRIFWQRSEAVIPDGICRQGARCANHRGRWAIHYQWIWPDAG